MRAPATDPVMPCLAISPLNHLARTVADGGWRNYGTLVQFNGKWQLLAETDAKRSCGNDAVAVEWDALHPLDRLLERDVVDVGWVERDHHTSLALGQTTDGGCAEHQAQAAVDGG